MILPETQELVVATCHGRGAPITGCPCGWCRIARPAPLPEPVRERLSFPSGELTEEHEAVRASVRA
jgi:hypothetical protein